MVEGVVTLMDRSPDDFTGPVNLGSPIEVTIRNFAETIIDLTGYRSKLLYKKLPPEDPAQRRPDITLARKTLNWEPSISLEAGLRKTVEYFEKLLEER